MQSWKESTELKMNCLAIRFFESEESHAIYFVVRNNLPCIFVEKLQELYAFSSSGMPEKLKRISI